MYSRIPEFVFRMKIYLGESENVKLPGNYNRNIMMIFKEAMSNCLKHAQARHVKLKIQKARTPGNSD